MDEGCPALTATRKLRAKEKCICAAGNGGRQIFDAIKAKITYQTEPAIYVSGQSACESMQVERFFDAGVGPEADVGIAGKEINRGISVTIAGCFGFGLGSAYRLALG